MKVSILIAHYNNNQYLEETLQSCYLQSHDDWEVILVDDGSKIKPDYSLIPEKHRNNVKFHFHDKNKGVGATFKKCADLSKGDLLCMLGAEDTLTIDALDICVQAHKNNKNVSLTNSQMYQCDENLNILGLYSYKEVAPKKSYIRNMTIGSLACFKREHYELTVGFSEYFKKAVDHDIYLKLDEVGELYFIDKPLYNYRKNPNGISQGENASRARLFSLKARLNAIQRRKRHATLILSLTEVLEVQLEYFQIKAQIKSQGRTLKFLLFFVCNSFHNPLVFFKRTTYSIIKQEIKSNSPLFNNR